MVIFIALIQKYVLPYFRYSRRILWLKVGRTNRNPTIVGSYFLDYIREIEGVPKIIRIDRGTENTLIADMQKALRWNHEDGHAGNRSVHLGKSSANQVCDENIYFLKAENILVI